MSDVLLIKIIELTVRQHSLAFIPASKTTFSLHDYLPIKFNGARTIATILHPNCT